MKYFYSLLVLLLALVLAAFIQQNGQDVVLRYFQWRTVPLPLSLLMILAFAGGYGLALVLGVASGIRSRVRVAAAKNEAKRLRKELGDLKEKEGAGPAEAPFRGAGDQDADGGAAPSGWGGEEDPDAAGRGEKGER